ncbi:DNA (cytosine-5-)-methyltransferase [Mycoplasma sp. CSL10137]|uniref:DNA cytosine methyltransferase n=1 Tax=unclassified Mycoplasma TaxID=2683645 RepID=UPI00197BBCC7|nr:MULTISPECIES: DNA (cytosine-5-)-methyltransferase [unclassified Mycoplasma]MBN4083292.1 DNA (cytosine-5-)-methyltransferase [Mycoplasma sp. CSL10137]MBN4084406.1 DNA (cytosine-5-)-methyltransferase [Mycoplasma sp. CSL10166]
MQKKRIKVLETFSGIGAQNKAMNQLNKKYNKKIFEIKAIADWDARANISYAQMHHNLEGKYLKILQQHNLNTEEQINFFLNKYTISLDSKKPSKITQKDYEFKQYLAASILLTNNQVDITKLDPNILEEEKIDLITYSFPCQGLSVASMGKAKGINNVESTSNLVWEIYRILNESKEKPKYLVMENVKNLLSQKFIKEYEDWKKVLKKLGYKTFTTVINALDSGSIQKRERVFAISILDNLKSPFKNDQEFKKYLDKKMEKKKLNIKNREKYFNKIFDFESNEKNDDFIINNTPSRERMIQLQINKKKVLNNSTNFVIDTVTTKQDRIPNVGIIEYKNNKNNKLPYRFISTKEAYMLMGFEDKDFDSLKNLIKKNILTKESLYRQAGNSIVVQAIKNIFETIKEIEDLNYEKND